MTSRHTIKGTRIINESRKKEEKTSNLIIRKKSQRATQRGEELRMNNKTGEKETGTENSNTREMMRDEKRRK